MRAIGRIVFVVCVVLTSQVSAREFEPPPRNTEAPGVANPPAALVPIPPIKEPLFGEGPISHVLQPWREWEKQLFDDHRIAFDIYYTLFYQGASNTITSPNELLNGRLDFGVTWDAIEIPDFGTGQFQLLIRSGQILNHDRSTSLSANVGSFTGVNALYDPDGFSLNVLTWTQGFLGNKVAFTVGKLHPNQYIDLGPVANDESRQFISNPFDGNNAIPNLGTYSPGLALQVAPDEFWYVHVVTIDSLGTPTNGLGTLDEGLLTTYLELGFKPVFGETVKGEFRFIGFYADVRGGSGGGFALNFDLTFHDKIVTFMRYGINNGEVAVVEQQFSAGVAIHDPLGRPDELAGIGIAWSKASASSLEDEVLIEMFYRIQLTESLQLSPDLQVLFHPTGNADVVFLPGIRLRADF